MCATLLILASVLSAVAAVPTSGRIAGGTTTTIAAYPFAASLSYNRLGVGIFQFSCGGAIISSRAILTGAFCLYGEQTFRYRVRVASATTNSLGNLHNAESFAIHPRYNPVTNENDIAILHVFPHILFGLNIQLGSLADSNYKYVSNKSVWAIGWGQINHGGALSANLRNVQLWLVGNDDCKSRYTEVPGPNVTSNMICALGFDHTGRGQCLGDNGSPLLDNGLIIGIYSWSHQCGTARYPGVNTYIPKYIEWIQTNY